MRTPRDIAPPVNLDAECALLGAILMNNDAYAAACSQGLTPHDFGEDIHSEIFSAAGRLIDAGKIVNPVTIKGSVPDIQIGDKTTAQYLASLAVNAVNVINTPDYAFAIIQAWCMREMLACGQMMQEAARITDELALSDEIEAISARLEAARARLNGVEGEGKDFAQTASESLQATMDAMSGKSVAGIDPNFPAIKQLIGPLRCRALVIVAGITKHGKSSLAEQLARGAADQGHPVLYYSGEMDGEELSMREYARDTGIATQRQKDGTLSDAEAEKLTMACKTVGKLPITVQDRRRTLDQFLREAKQFRKRHRGTHCLVVVDSMLLFDRARHEVRMSDHEYADMATDKLKALAKDIDCPVVALAQLKKNTIEKDRRYSVKQDANYFRAAISRRPRASDIYGSVEKHADHVLIVFNQEVVLRDIEPPEANEAEHLAWEEVLAEVQDKAEILLAISRSARWPARRTVQWDGVRHHFSFKSDQQRGFF